MLLSCDFEEYYVTNFNMMMQMKMSLSDIENLIPFEYEIYVGLLIDYNKKQNEGMKENE